MTRLLLCLIAFSAIPARGHAQTPPPSFLFGAAGVLRPTAAFDGVAAAGAQVDLRYRFAQGYQLGAVVEGLALPEEIFVGGEPTREGGSFAGRLLAMLPIAALGPLHFDFRLATGAALLRTAAQSSTRSLTEFAFLATMLLGERWMARAGAILAIELELSPGVEVANQAQLLSAGAGYALSPSYMVYALIDAGGSLGYDGDNAKVIVQATLGMRVALGRGDARVAF